MRLVGQWTAHGKHVNRGFSFSVPGGLSALGENEFFRAPSERTEAYRLRGYLEEHQFGISRLIALRPNAFTGPRKYVFVYLPLSSLSPCFFSLLSLSLSRFFATIEHCHFLNGRPAVRRERTLMRIDGDCRLPGEL